MGTARALMFDFNGTLSQDEPLAARDLPAPLRPPRPAPERGASTTAASRGCRRRRSSAAGSASTGRCSSRSSPSGSTPMRPRRPTASTVTRAAARGGPLRGRAGSRGDRLRRVPGRDRAGRRGRRDRRRAHDDRRRRRRRARQAAPRGLPAGARAARSRRRRGRRVRGHRGRRRVGEGRRRCAASPFAAPCRTSGSARPTSSSTGSTSPSCGGSSASDDPRDRPGHDGNHLSRRRRRAAARRSRLPGDRPALSRAGLGRARSRGDLVERPRRPRQRSRTPGSAPELDAIGITNQRETTVVWERASGRPVHPAIVWQDRRTAARCAELPADSSRADRARCDPYFSATKLEWILAPHGAAAAGAGLRDDRLLAGLEADRRHDARHGCDERVAHDAPRPRDGSWDDELLELFSVDRAILPTVVPSAGVVAEATPARRDRSAGGHGRRPAGCALRSGLLRTGQAKATYGTGTFVLANVGELAGPAAEGLLKTAAAVAPGARRQFAAEGAVLVGGAAVQWLRDGLGVIDDRRRERARSPGRSTRRTASSSCPR